MGTEKNEEKELQNIIIEIDRVNTTYRAIVPEETTQKDIEKSIYSLANFAKENWNMNYKDFENMIVAIEICLFSSKDKIEDLLKDIQNLN